MSVTGEVVSHVMLHGEKVDLGQEMTVAEVQTHLRNQGMGDFVDSRTAVIRDGILLFEQENAEKGA